MNIPPGVIGDAEPPWIEEISILAVSRVEPKFANRFGDRYQSKYGDRIPG